MKRIAVSAVVVGVALLAGCAADGPGMASADPVSRPGDAALDEAVMSRLGSLEGEWEMQDESGAWVPASVFAVSSNGTVVREIMFPGTQHEMTNLYHMDGTDAVVTHYCAVGNQPRMVAEGLEQTAEGAALDFEFESVSNLRPEHKSVMGSLRLVFVDADHLRQHWASLDAEGNESGSVTFDMRRKR